MPQRVNPFQPNSPVHPGMFAGRGLELQSLETCLLQTRAGSPKHVVVTGERGIGKTSLINYFSWLAQGTFPLFSGGEPLRFLVVDTEVDPSTTQLGLVQKIEVGLTNVLARSEPERRWIQEAWHFISRVEAFGVSLRENQRQRQSETLLDELAISLDNTIKRVRGETESPFSSRFDGAILLVDEADKASPDLQLGSMLKLLLEKLQRRNCIHFAVGLAGLPGIRDVLLRSHESSLRLFDVLNLGRLSDEDVNEVIDRCMAKANEGAERPTTVAPEGREHLVALSEGYPHFVQQFGYSAFEQDSDYEIDVADVRLGAFRRSGAIEKIGERYYRDNFYNKISKEAYRQVLRIMADIPKLWISKEEIRAQFRGQESTLSNAIHALRTRGIILAKEGERGIYRLQHKGFALWIKLNASGEHLQVRDETEGRVS